MNFTNAEFITVVGLILSLLAIPFFRFLYLKYVENKPSVFFEELDEKFINLNDQLSVSNILDKKGKLSASKIKYAHFILFQKEIEKAGEYRDHDVEIISPKSVSETEEYGTVMIETSTLPKASKLYYKDEIEKAQKKNISMWNKWVIKKRRLSDKSKLDLISRFHTYFMVVHPFFDGNGRIGRQILSEQLSYLYDSHIEFNPSTIKYYQAVDKASKGDESALKSLIKEQIKQNI